MKMAIGPDGLNVEHFEMSRVVMPFQEMTDPECSICHPISDELRGFLHRNVGSVVRCVFTDDDIGDRYEISMMVESVNSAGATLTAAGPVRVQP